MAIHPTPEWDVVTPLDDSRELYNTQKTRFGGGLRPRRGTFGRRSRENVHFRPENPLRKFRVATPRSDSRTHSLLIDYTPPWSAAAAPAAVRPVPPLVAWPRSRRSKAPTTPPPLRARRLRRRVRSTFSSTCWLRTPSSHSSSLEAFHSPRQRFRPILRSSAATLHSHLPPTSRRSWRPSLNSTVASPLRSSLPWSL